MTIRRAAAAAVAAALLVFATPATPAAAITTMPAAGCATGDITAYAGRLDATGAPVVSLSGWIRPCMPVAAGTLFAFAHYFTEAGVLPLQDTFGTGVRAYTSSTASTGWSVTTTLDTAEYAELEGTYGPLAAICLVRNRSGRLACVAVDRPEPGAAPVVTPIDNDDGRLLRAPVIGGFDQGDIVALNPHCGNCV